MTPETLPLTLLDRLVHQAGAQPAKRAFTFLRDGGGAEVITYGDLDARARRVAAALRGIGVAGGPAQPRALLLLPPSSIFVEALFGCFHAGVCAVPAHPPSPGRLRQTLPRLEAIAADAGPSVVIATRDLLETRALVPELAGVPWLVVDDGELPPAPAVAGQARAGDLAILQYSSGSTGTPRGVMVSHENLMANEAVIHQAFEHEPSTVVLGWLPFQHDMGLIGNVLQPVYAGAECVLMTPTAFLKRPLRWLQAISERRATTSGAPCFAYEMCVDEAARRGEAALAGLDLSSWKLAFVGAEPVRAGTLDRFARAFAPHGFRREALYPCYGLAEATLMVTGGSRADAPRVRSFAREGGGETPRVSCGPVRPGLELAIVDPLTRERVEAGAEGEVWVRGPSVARGYFGQPEASRGVFSAELEGSAEGSGGWLRTGDLGRLDEGELFVTGRLKDVVVLRGEKRAAEDIEQAVDRQRIPGLRAGACVAFAHDDGASETLVVVQEVERSAATPLAELAERIAAALAEEQGAAKSVVALVRAGAIPRTTSGKVRRSACRVLFAQGALEEVHRATAGQRGKG